jgi:hypothetical protein
MLASLRSGVKMCSPRSAQNCYIETELESFRAEASKRPSVFWVRVSLGN